MTGIDPYAQYCTYLLYLCYRTVSALPVPKSLGRSGKIHRGKLRGRQRKRKGERKRERRSRNLSQRISMSNRAVYLPLHAPKLDGVLRRCLVNTASTPVSWYCNDGAFSGGFSRQGLF